MTDILTIIRRAALGGVAALAVFSCGLSKEEDPEPVKAPALCRTVYFHASQPQTKAQFGTPENGVYPTLWTSSDTEAKISLNYGSAVAAEVTLVLTVLMPAAKMLAMSRPRRPTGRLLTMK